MNFHPNELKNIQEIIDFYSKNIEHSLEEFFEYINQNTTTTQEWRNVHGDNIFNLLPKPKELEAWLQLLCLKEGVSVDSEIIKL